MSPEKMALAEGISTLILLSGQQSSTHWHSQLTQCRTQHELFLEGTAPDNALGPPASSLANAAFPGIAQDLPPRLHTGFSPCRNPAALRAHPDCNQHSLHLQVFALAPSMTR